MDEQEVTAKITFDCSDKAKRLVTTDSKWISDAATTVFALYQHIEMNIDKPHGQAPNIPKKKEVRRQIGIIRERRSKSTEDKGKVITTILLKLLKQNLNKPIEITKHTTEMIESLNAQGWENLNLVWKTHK